jgi:tetratricopeptide (TPR) repeat protein
MNAPIRERLARLLRQNTNTFIIAGLLCVLGGVLLFLKGRHQDTTEARMAQALEHPDRNLLQALYQEHGRSPYAPWILHRLGQSYLHPLSSEKGAPVLPADPAKAIDCFEKLAREHPDHLLTPLALRTLAVLQQNIGDLAGMRRSYQKLLTDHRTTAAAEMVWRDHRPEGPPADPTESEPYRKEMEKLLRAVEQEMMLFQQALPALTQASTPPPGHEPQTPNQP